MSIPVLFVSTTILGTFYLILRSHLCRSRNVLLGVQIMSTIFLIFTIVLWLGFLGQTVIKLYLAASIAIFSFLIYRLSSWYKHNTPELLPLRLNVVYLIPLLLSCFSSLLGWFFADQAWDSSMYHNVVSLNYEREYSLSNWIDLTPWQWYPASLDALRPLFFPAQSSIGNSIFNSFFILLASISLLEALGIKRVLTSLTISLIPFSVPVMVSQIPTAYIDTALTSIAVATFAQIYKLAKNSSGWSDWKVYAHFSILSSSIFSAKWTGVLLVISASIQYVFFYFIYLIKSFKVSKIQFRHVVFSLLPGSSLLAGGLVGLTPWLLRNYWEGFNPFFPVSVRQTNDTPYTFQSLSETSSLGNRAIGSQITDLESKEGIALLLYQYVQTPIEFIIRLVKFTLGANDQVNSRWLLMSSNYDARLGGFFLLISFVVLLYLFFYLFEFIKMKSFKGFKDEISIFAGISLIMLVLMLYATNIGWYPRYWISLAWVSSTFMFVAVFQKFGHRFRNAISFLALALGGVSIVASVLSLSALPKDNFGDYGYGNRLVQAKIDLLNSIDKSQGDCNSTLVLGHQLQFSSAVLTPPCTNRIKTAWLNDADQKLLTFGEIRPSKSRASFDLANLGNWLSVDTRDANLLMLVDHSLDRLAATERRVETELSRLGFNYMRLNTEEPYLSVVTLYLITYDK